MATRAGKGSPHLDKGEQVQAEQHAAPQALVIHEVVREEGEQELERRLGAVAWSGLAAGLSMGFSFVGLSLIRAVLPDAPWSRLIYAVGYTVGFVITILGRQELFTESTLTAVLPLLVRRNVATFVALVRFWAVVLVANLIGTGLFAGLLNVHGLFSEAIVASMQATAHDAVFGPLLPGFVKSILAGWLIALMAWMLPSAKSARLFVILLITYMVALGGFPHIVAGSVEAAFAVFQGTASWHEYLTGFLLPTLAGNTVGGVALVALLNHAPLSPELQGRSDNREKAGALADRSADWGGNGSAKDGRGASEVSRNRGNEGRRARAPSRRPAG